MINSGFPIAIGTAYKRILVINVWPALAGILLVMLCPPRQASHHFDFF